MADTGLKSPTVSVSGGQWSNPDNVFTSNNSRAREDVNGQSQQWSTFEFGVPAGATIDGIQVSIEGCWEDSNSIDVELSWNGGSNWTSPVKNASGFGYSDVTDTVGGAADTWNRTWSDSDFSNANFRCRLTKQGQDYVWMDVDHLQVQVYYTPGSSSPTITDAEDETLLDGETTFVITGTDFGITKGTGSVELGDGSTYPPTTLVNQVTTSWSDTSIEITVNHGSLGLGTAYLYVTNDDSNTSDAYTVQLIEEGGGGGPWYNSNWIYRKKFTTDYTKVAGTSHTDFPIAVVHPADSDFYSKCRSDGYDILFTSSDGTTKLDHEIEHFESDGSLLAWVRVPTLSGTENQDFYMYYGNTGAADQSNMGGTWNAGFQGVYHLSEASGSALDSSGNGNNLSVNGSPTRQATGVLSDCVDFTGSGQNFRASAGTVHNYTGDLTISALVYADAIGGHKSMVGKGDNQYMLRVDSSQSDLHFFVYNGSGWDGSSTNSTFPTGAWKHVAGRHNGTTNVHEVYLDGTVGVDVGNSAIAADTGAYFQIGANYDYSDRRWDGKIDEVRISNVVRSGDWLDTEFENLINNSSFYSTALAAGIGEETEGSGYSNSVNTVTSMGKINGISVSNVSKVNTI